MGTVHNALRRFGDIQRAAKIAFGLDAGDGGLERLSESIVVTKELLAYEEDAIHRGERICAGRTNSNSGVGVYGACGLSCEDAGWLIKVEQLWVSSTVNARVYIGWAPARLANVSTNWWFRDNRYRTNTVPVGELSNGTAAPSMLSQVIGLVDVPAGYTIPINLPACIVNKQPTCLAVEPNAQNVDVALTALWRERPLLPGEYVA